MTRAVVWFNAPVKVVVNIDTREVEEVVVDMLREDVTRAYETAPGGEPTLPEPPTLEDGSPLTPEQEFAADRIATSAEPWPPAQIEV